MTRFRHVLLACTALFAAPAAAQTTPPVAAPAPATSTPATPAAVTDVDPALWVVRDEDTTIYLFGTVHLLKPGLGWFDEAVKDAFDASDTLVVEMIEPNPQEMQALVGRTAMAAPGKGLSTHLTPEQQTKLGAALQSVGAPPTAMEPFEPWFASTVIALMPLPALGYDPSKGVDNELQAAARAASKRVEALETAEQQIGFFDSLPLPVQTRILVKTVDEFDDVGPTIDRMVREWGAGDPDALAATMNEQMLEVPEAARALLTDRNARWADWIDARMERPGTVFMAVGAGHLAGEGSVQQQLRRHDLTATREAY
ncbi:hypothetical protein GGR88_001094 [Sphingomonas jejuensis]|uniref:TraB/GumN family protein n=1 Tax=Sphingomonas jejuensis TaxID=904715 RepID=A0ABX0XLM8_9SPHN|nr:TraB/GumN family protein [Sphingomonas jejuensis]NJC33620.1 hypothetical protein [Sphingomonas jejuensis]